MVDPNDKSRGSSSQLPLEPGSTPKARSATAGRNGNPRRPVSAAGAPAEVAPEAETGTPRNRPSPRHPGWLQRQRDDLIRDALLGLVILAVGAGFAAYYDQRLSQRAKSSENTRFVRQTVIDRATTKPFIELNLRGRRWPDWTSAAPNPGQPAPPASPRSASRLAAPTSDALTSTGRTSTGPYSGTHCCPTLTCATPTSH